MCFIENKQVVIITFMANFLIQVFSSNQILNENNGAEIEIRNLSISKLRFPSIYHANGMISIPSAKIVEPFEVWYAGKYNRSRIDYYGGTLCFIIQ